MFRAFAPRLRMIAMQLPLRAGDRDSSHGQRSPDRGLRFDTFYRPRVCFHFGSILEA